MTRRPFRPDEVDVFGNEHESTIADLERYLADSADDPSSGFSDRVMTRIAGEPAPRRGLLAAINSAFTSERGRIALLAATVAVAILAVVAAGQLSRLMPSQFGASPSPSVSAPSVPPTPSSSAEPSATPSDDEESESPDASDDDDETVRPSGSPEESDNSGPGGGGGGDGDNSGPGGGGGDDSGNSGPGSGSASPEAADD